MVDRESPELLLAQGMSVERIAKRFGKDPSTISYWMKKHGLEAPNRDKHGAKGGIERARLEQLVDAGMTIAEIATDVGVSKATVRHWMRKYGLRTQNARGRRSARMARLAKDAGLLAVTLRCIRHGDTDFILEGRGRYRCKRCRSDAVARRRRRVKEILVQEAGGRCCVCGYDRCMGALAFHHVNPASKRLELNAKGVALSIETLREEAKKRVVLCANCHAEVENDVTELPARVLHTLRWANTP